MLQLEKSHCMLCMWLHLIFHIEGVAKEVGKVKSCIIEFPSH